MELDETSFSFSLFNNTFASWRIVLFTGVISGKFIGIIAYGTSELYDGGVARECGHGLAYTTTSVGGRVANYFPRKGAYTSDHHRQLLGRVGFDDAHLLYDVPGNATFRFNCTQQGACGRSCAIRRETLGNGFRRSFGRYNDGVGIYGGTIFGQTRYGGETKNATGRVLYFLSCYTCDIVSCVVDRGQELARGGSLTLGTGRNVDNTGIGACVYYGRGFLLSGRCLKWWEWSRHMCFRCWSIHRP